MRWWDAVETLARYFALLQHYLGIISSISPISRQYLASISPVSHQYLASISRIFRQYFTSISPVFHQHLTSMSPVSRQYLASISPLFPSWAGKLYYCKDFCNKSHPFRLPVRIRIRMVSGCRRGGQIWVLKWAGVELRWEIILFVRISIINRTRSGTRTGSESEWFRDAAAEDGSEFWNGPRPK